MNKIFILNLLLISLVFNSCTHHEKRIKIVIHKKTIVTKVIVDCHYTFEEAIAGSNAPDTILNELRLIDVQYYSLDGKIHAGQILTNKKIAKELDEMFQFMLLKHFPVASVVPIVKYHWNDNASMQCNNSYSFCYRNTSFSKHAKGMAIDINPFFNPVRWKKGYEQRINKPIGAVYNHNRPGTFYEQSVIVQEFKKHGFRWGHSFTRNFDDHHFEY